MKATLLLAFVVAAANTAAGQDPCVLPNKYLGGCPDGGCCPDEGCFESLDDAKAECLKVSNCGGITLWSSGKKWELRKGTDAISSPGGEMSMLRACFGPDDGTGDEDSNADDDAADDEVATERCYNIIGRRRCKRAIRKITDFCEFGFAKEICALRCGVCSNKE